MPKAYKVTRHKIKFDKNLFLHYTFDKWMRIHYPNIPFERYADDTILAERSDPKVMSVHKELSVKSRVRGDFHARFCERVRVILL